MKPIAQDLWLLHYKAPLLGDYLGRNVSVVRLRSGDLVIHSTGPFSPEDVENIKALGRPAFLLDALSKHDTFAKEGRAAFPDLPYYAPAGFSETVGFPTESLSHPPSAWAGQLDGVHLNGMEGQDEYAFLHRASRTLIVCDLVFHVTTEAPLGARLFATVGIVGGRTHDVGMPRPERSSIKDADAFRRSLATLMAWDFDRIIVGHGEVVETGGKALLAEALREAGFGPETAG